MSQRHAAAKATRSAVGSFAKTSKPAPLAAAHLKDDVEFAKAFVQAALHGHSPLWKFYGWRNSAAERSKDPKINPHCYLRRDLIEGTSPSGSGASSYYSTPPPRKFLKEQAKLNYLRRFTRPFSTSAASRERYFKEEADEEDFEQEDPAEDADGLPALLLASAQRKLQPGDWVQMRM